MICINYHCGFLNEKRSLFVFSNKAKDEELARLKRLDYHVYSIEESKWTQPSLTISKLNTKPFNVLSSNMSTEKQPNEALSLNDEYFIKNAISCWLHHFPNHKWTPIYEELRNRDSYLTSEVDPIAKPRPPRKAKSTE